MYYTAQAGAVRQTVIDRLPRTVGSFIPSTDPALGTTRDAEVDDNAVSTYAAGEWLLVVARDAS